MTLHPAIELLWRDHCETEQRPVQSERKVSPYPHPPADGRRRRAPAIAMTVTYEIHPAIGVARVGSSRIESEEGYFLGPEPEGSPPACYRDPAGALKRQAARSGDTKLHAR
jgi:L-Lysine epsilon oxidase N-terminal